MSREGTWTCETCPPANKALPKTNDGNNRLVCFLCDWNICTDCVGAEVTLVAPEKEDWQNFFENQADKNQDGFLSVDEVHAAFPEHDKEWAQRLVDAIDSDHDGRVSLEEFRAYYHSEIDDDTYHRNLVSKQENSEKSYFSQTVFFLDYKQKKASVKKTRISGWVDQEKQLDREQRGVGADKVGKKTILSKSQQKA